ncbi:MAG: flagellar biosynthetic protein FliR [Acetobacteraceae bacterium]|nr:flagellar biosynthetic protein FliR [Acetobacteraceae bacterium]
MLGRCAAAISVLPGFGESASPAVLRAGIALGMAILLTPGIAPLVPPVPEASLVAISMILAETATGLWLGWLARLFALALPTAAQFIAYLLGLSSVLQPDPELGPQTAALSRLFGVAAPLVLLTSGLFMLPLSALAGSYRVITPGGLLPAADGVQEAVAAVSLSFALALRLAAPFVVAGVVWNACIGLVARLVPRLQVYFAAMPAQIVGGFALLAFLVGAVLQAWETALQDRWMNLPGIG